MYACEMELLKGWALDPKGMWEGEQMDADSEDLDSTLPWLPSPRHQVQRSKQWVLRDRQSVHFQARTSASWLNSRKHLYGGLIILFVNRKSCVCSFLLWNAGSHNQRFYFVLCPMRILILIPRPLISIFMFIRCLCARQCAKHWRNEEIK